MVMWMGELITQRGIGNGMSLLIFASVVSDVASGGAQLRAEGGNVKFTILIVLALAILVSIVIVENGQRRIPVNFAKRIVGRRMYGGQSTYIPLKVNQAGVIPVIFASSMLYLPVLLTNVLPTGGVWDSIRGFIDDNLLQTGNFWYIAIFGLMIVFFAYFYTAISFDPVKQADTIRKQGGFIPGIRPGPQTERHLAKILSRITLPGALFLAIVALTPQILLAVWNVNSFFGFGGTSLLIATGVALETMKQIDSQLMMRNYESFLK
jgi:preprotein translocase subunit SecY